MPLPFATVSALFQQLENLECRDPPLLPTDKATRLQATVKTWFLTHRTCLESLSAREAAALLSTLLPERRRDRVFNVQAQGLCRILCRSLGLGATRRADLEAYRVPGRGDLGLCLQRVIRDGNRGETRDKRRGTPLSIAEVDAMLHKWASRSRFSDPGIVSDVSSDSRAAHRQSLCDVLGRLSPEESKWLIRLILKDLSPIRIDDELVLNHFHFVLPDLLRFQDNLERACEVLRGPLQHYPPNPDPRSRVLWLQQAAECLRPQVGIKVGRPFFHKARSIANCLKMLGQNTWVLERKYDGEYCEIHIDRANHTDPADMIRIFSKSGKDSTADRNALHPLLVSSLRLGQPDCKIKSRAILLGEMLIYSNVNGTHTVLPFEKIRNHVMRSGVRIGTAKDSPVKSQEQPGIVLFDLLLLDDDVIMTQSIDRRRKRLRTIYNKQPGRVMSTEWKLVDFSHPDSEARLMQQFAASIASRCEGLILKPCNVPYLSLGPERKSWTRSYIKLKKDYIEGLGDEADLAVIGASYHAQRAMTDRGCKNIQWTDFYLACLLNKDDVQRFDVRPRFHALGSISDAACIPAACLETLNQIGRFVAKPFSADCRHNDFELVGDPCVTMDVYFTSPIVVEVLGSGFVKPSNCSYLMLRHPRFRKVHEDRSWKDVDSFAEFQRKGVEARDAPTEDLDEEQRMWLDKLIRKSKKKFAQESNDHSTNDTSEVLNTSPRFTVAPSAPHHASRGEQSFMGRSSLMANKMQSRKRALYGDDVSPTARKTRRSLAELHVNSRSLTETPTRSSPSIVSEPLVSSQGLAALAKSSPAELEQLGTSTAASTPREAAAMPTTACEDSISSPILPLARRGCDGSTSCPFQGAVVFLAPCISNMLWITEDLLPLHDCVVIDDLRFWDRDSFAHAPRSAIVSESQAYVGCRKLVLVEKHRAAQVRETTALLRGLNGGQFRERVDVYDWRILVACQRHVLAAEADAKCRIGTVGANVAPATTRNWHS